MKGFLLAFLVLSTISFGQKIDTLNGFLSKVQGEEINYFSPLHQFAPNALLTRANGQMPIAWNAPIYSGTKKTVCYELLIGHSTGTSSGERHFDVFLNDRKLVTITTSPKKNGYFELTQAVKKNLGFSFLLQEYDVNNDAFGKLYLTLPASYVTNKAVISIIGQQQESRDWLMVFMYQKGLKIEAQPTQLITRKENKRQLNVVVDNPYSDGAILRIQSAHFTAEKTLVKGFNQLSFPVYDKAFSGNDTLTFTINSNESITKNVSIPPLREYSFQIVHHSHNDIGYSHLQTEVERIQIKNIKDALRWVEQPHIGTQKPFWHIESLWAVENFLRSANAAEEAQFVQAVKNGNIILSANYANILTGLCRQEELNWVLEYAKTLEKKYGFHIQNAMMTDIPGITWAGLNSYVENNIPYLSLGPNYVESLPDKGDRVGGVIKEQGDEVFYWKPDSSSTKKLLVWTAGKGYSFFHGITESEKQQKWEQRISNYCNELAITNYPYDLVQLRYTKNADNGPVDTLLSAFIEQWNQQYSTPQLTIASLDELFHTFEETYQAVIPVRTGEISPYWEDGAYSTAVEEMQNRQLALQTIALEAFVKTTDRYAEYQPAFVRLHRNIILFHEHTWGAWCSISDPEIFFTTEQWRIKQSFLDAAQQEYDQLAKAFSYVYMPQLTVAAPAHTITDFVVDEQHGGLKSLLVNGQNVVSTTSDYRLFEPIYALGINPMVEHRSTSVTITTLEDSPKRKTVQVTTTLPSMQTISITYALLKKWNRLFCHYVFDKAIEKNKESMHIAFPFHQTPTAIQYGSSPHLVSLNKDQLPGSNNDFICVEDQLVVVFDSLNMVIRSPEVNLFEIGEMINEDKENGVKKWRTETASLDQLFLYVFNNYWHTNYKAYQEGRMDFEIEISFE